MAIEVKVTKKVVEAEPLFSMKTLAQYFDISYDVVNEMVKNDKIPYVMIGGRKRFIKRFIDNWLENNQVNVNKKN